MKKPLLFIIYILTYTSVYAQILGQGIIDQPQIERDRVANGRNSPQRLHSDNQKWLMNGGLEEMMKRKRNNFDISYNPPVRGYSGESFSGGIIVSNDKSTVRTPNSSKSSSRINNSKKGGPDFNKINDNWNRHLANMEAARQRQEEIKRRKREEDDRSERQARVQHLIITDGLYRNAAARDYWHATVGAEILSEYHAEDFVPLPQKKEVSGNDLLNRRQAKKGNYYVVENEVLKKNRSVDEQDKKISLPEEGEMSEKQIGLWDNEYKGRDIVQISKNTDKRKSPKVIVRHDELPIDSLALFVLPKYGLVGVWADSMIVLKDAKHNKVAWTNGEFYSYVIPCGGKLIGKCNQSLYVINEEQSDKLVDFSRQDFSLFNYDDNSLFVLYGTYDVSTILLLDVSNKSYSEILRIPYNIWSVASNGELIFTLVENEIFAIDLYGTPKKIFSSEDEVNDMVMTNDGLIIATDKNILRISGSQDNGIFYDKGAKRLWAEDDNLYVQNMEDDILYFKKD